jgi:hypothetical protein
MTAKKHRKGTKNYYRLLQVPVEALEEHDSYMCKGCVFDDFKDDGTRCPDRDKENLTCQTWSDDSVVDYIFVPATKQGLADYVVHRLEHS